MTSWLTASLSSGGKSIDITGKYKGMTLSQAEDTLRAVKGHEEAVIFDKDMNVIAAFSGGDTSVNIPSRFRQQDGITVTHNHPLSESEYGGVLSPADVAWFAGSNAAEIRAVASGQGEFVYSLQIRGARSHQAEYELMRWAVSERDYVTPKSEGGSGRLQSDYRKLYNQYKNSGMSKKSARHAAWQQATGNIERRLAQKAKSLESQGVFYFAKNNRYNVNR